ncbi:MAG TPA: site-specific integrase [Chitinophagaceae bacterium]
MSTIRILFWLNRSKVNRKLNKAPIYLRITVKGKKKESATGHWINPNEWDTLKHRAKGNSESSSLINNYLIATKAKFLQTQNNLTVAGSPNITAEYVMERLLGVNPEKKTLLQLFDYHNSQVKEQIGNGFREGTYKHYVVTRNKVEKFLKDSYGVDDFPLESLSHQFVNDFHYYLKTAQSLSGNTAMKKIKQLKTVISIALKNEWLTRNPFANFKCWYRDPKREALTQEEIDLLASKSFSTERLTVIRDIFLFSCYTGLRFSDVQKLTPENIMKGVDGEQWLTVDTIKTDDRCNIPLLLPALQLIEKYGTHPECLNKGVLFPTRSNQKTNEFLKEIAEITGIKKKLHFHLARHTFATTITLNNGVSLEAVGKMLGQKNIRTTQIYAKMNNTRISNEMNLVKNKFEVIAGQKMATTSNR